MSPLLIAFTDEPAAAAGLVRVLSASGSVKLSAVYDNTYELGAALCALRPRLLLLDLTPCITARVILDLRAKAPDCGIVLWTRAITPFLARQAVENGVRGILRKTAPEAALFRCLEVVARGGLWFEEALQVDDDAFEFVRLSEREGQIVRLLTSGLKNKEIAAATGISEGTVKVYLHRLFRKLRVEGRTELAIRALRDAPLAEASLKTSVVLGQMHGWQMWSGRQGRIAWQ